MNVRRLLSASALVTVVSVATALTGAQQSAAPIVTANVGPQVGTTVPPLSGIDQFGKAQTLASLSGPKGLMLVFSRSADWCPYCKSQLVELQGRYDDIKTARARARVDHLRPARDAEEVRGFPRYHVPADL